MHLLIPSKRLAFFKWNTYFPSKSLQRQGLPVRVLKMCNCHEGFWGAPARALLCCMGQSGAHPRLSRMVPSACGVDSLFKNLYISFKARIWFLLQWHQMKACFFSLHLFSTYSCFGLEEREVAQGWIAVWLLFQFCGELMSSSWEDSFDLLLISSWMKLCSLSFLSHWCFLFL